MIISMIFINLIILIFTIFCIFKLIDIEHNYLEEYIDKLTTLNAELKEENEDLRLQLQEILYKENE